MYRQMGPACGAQAYDKGVGGRQVGSEIWRSGRGGVGRPSPIKAGLDYLTTLTYQNIRPTIPPTVDDPILASSAVCVVAERPEHPRGVNNVPACLPLFTGYWLPVTGNW